MKIETRCPPAPDATLAKNEALKEYGFAAKNTNWAWGGRNESVNSVCFIVWERDIAGPERLGQFIVNLLLEDDFQKGGNGFNDRVEMIREAERGAEAYALVATRDTGSDSVKAIYPRLFRVASIFSTSPHRFDAVLQIA